MEKIDKNWRVVNLLKVFIFVFFLAIFIYSAPYIWNAIGIGTDVPLFNIKQEIFLFLFSLITFFILLYIIWIYLFYRNFHYELAKDFVRIKKGILTKSEIMIPYSKIRDVKISQGILQRFFNISTLTIELISYNEADIVESEIPGIAKADKVAEKILLKVKG